MGMNRRNLEINLEKIIETNQENKNKQNTLLLPTDPTSQRSIYHLRTKALDHLLDGAEWHTILIYFVRNKDLYEYSFKLRPNELNIMIENQYRTIGEMIYNESNKNKALPLIALSLELILDEIKSLFHIQRQKGNAYAKSQIETKYLQFFIK